MVIEFPITLENNFTYDKNGNLLSLTRMGPKSAIPVLNDTDDSDYGSMDVLDYAYHDNEMSNRLYKVRDDGEDAFGFKDSSVDAQDYWYDANGNLTQDLNKGIQANGITYNHLNLPTQFTLNSGTIDYIYDATGMKQKKIVSTGSDTEYAGNYIYENNKLQFFNTPEGYVEPKNPDNLTQGFDYIYQYIDHLGNVRLSYTDNNGTTEIVGENNYYPFGLKHKGYNNISPLGNSAAKKFKYNGQEYEESLGLNLYEMNLRQYDPAIARWTGIDPVVHHSMSTYTAFDNNPVFWADPSGANSAVYNRSGIIFQGFEDSAQFDDEEEEEEEPNDDITVNSEGIVTGIVRNNKPDRFFDEEGNELKFNDPSGVDGPYMPDEWRRGDRVFYPITIEEMNQQIIDSGIIFERWMANISTGGANAGAGYWLLSLFVAAGKGHGEYDFAENYLVHRIDGTPSINTERSRGLTQYNDGTGFFRFGNTNNIYNLYDAGNYMWGRAMRISGFSYGEARFGSQANELGQDTEADQRAIKNAFDGN